MSKVEYIVPFSGPSSAIDWKDDSWGGHLGLQTGRTIGPAVLDLVVTHHTWHCIIHAAVAVPPTGYTPLLDAKYKFDLSLV